MNEFLSSASLKNLAKGQLLGKYGTVIGILLLHLLCTFPLSAIISPLSEVYLTLYFPLLFMIDIFSGFFIAGEALVYLKLACGQRPSVSDLFYYFHGPYAQKGSKVVRTQIILSAVSVVCTMPYTYVGRVMLESVNISDLYANELPFSPALFLLYSILLVAGCAINVFVQLLLSQIYYLMLDFPEYTALQLIKTVAPKLIKGHKARLFYIQISFIPLMILCIFSFGIGFLWLYPYMQATYANFYLDLVKKKGTAAAF